MPVATVTSYLNYVPNPGYPAAPPDPCSDAQITSQKVCGVVENVAPGPGESTEVNWVQLDFTGAGANTAKALNAGTELLVRRASIGAPSTNAAATTIGPNSSANADTIGVGQFGYIIEMPDGTAFDLDAWYAKSTSAAQPMIILYLPA